MSTPYQVTITIGADDVATLQSEGYFLYGFKAVQGPSTGVPLVWFKTNRYSENNIIEWTESYQAYTSMDVIGPNLQISSSAEVAITLGEVFQVTGNGGTGTVVEGTDAQAIGIQNTTTTDFTCGISQQSNGTYSPTCAFDLQGGMEDLIVPIEQVFLMFATQEVNTGTVLEQSYSYGALVDLTASSEMAVTFSLQQQGQWVPAPGVTPQPPNVDLVPLLISQSAGVTV